jgi:hypothetical protein
MNASQLLDEPSEAAGMKGRPKTDQPSSVVPRAA